MPPSDFRVFSDFLKISKNAKNCTFINFWAPGMLNSYSAHQKVGNRWSQLNFSSKFKIFKFLSEIKKIEIRNFHPSFLAFEPITRHWTPPKKKRRNSVSKLGLRPQTVPENAKWCQKTKKKREFWPVWDFKHPGPELQPRFFLFLLKIWILTNFWPPGVLKSNSVYQKVY